MQFFFLYREADDIESNSSVWPNRNGVKEARSSFNAALCQYETRRLAVVCVLQQHAPGSPTPLAGTSVDTLFSARLQPLTINFLSLNRLSQYKTLLGVDLIMDKGGCNVFI